ncbi:receptor-like protein EIX1 [Humulus lupulus]|uniref:receptor-like protein EIX1 n=1 Tax=Humulus lupulus TaxID=3486 RepID=UPI002B400DFF|nr:receptor-like protein EIX1 [Humulus lupulus]
MERVLSDNRFFLFVLFFTGVVVQLCVCSNSTFGCIKEERVALLKLKKSFKVGISSWFPSWTGKDCCKWKGVSCSKTTGHVLKLNLSIQFPGGTESTSSPMVDSSVVALKHLEFLDLSGNNFQGSHIPHFLGSLKSLRYLNLSCAHFKGKIPEQLGNLSHLETLDLSNQETNFTNSDLYAENFKWVSRLVYLKHLDMNYVNLTTAVDLMQVLITLPSLLHVKLENCGIHNVHFSPSSFNSTLIPSSIQSLSLASNMLHGKIHIALPNMTQSFHSYNNNTTSPFWLGNLNSLVYLNLEMNEFNDFEGGLWSLLNNACSLKSLHLSSNQFYGNVLETKNTSSRCREFGLEFLDLGGNRVSGSIPDWLGQLSNLKELHLSNNQLNGTITPFIGRLLTLEHLDLSNNKLIGSLPYSLGQLVHLRTLDVSCNFLEGVVSESHFANLSNLKKLIISANHLICQFDPNWTPPFFNLEVLNMSSCQIRSKFPEWLRNLSIIVLNLSNTSISGNFPTWQSSFIYIDLSMNQISGNLPTNFVSNLSFTLRLANNFINGSIPDSWCKLEFLLFLDVSKNKLSGEVPKCWGYGDTQFSLINLSSNRLSGTIPSFSHCFLRWLHLNNNSLSGELPQSLSNCTELELLDVGDNNLSGTIPYSIGEISSLQILRLRNNMLNGDIPSRLCQLSGLQIMDLAGNKLTRGIPRCFELLIGMATEINEDRSVLAFPQYYRMSEKAYQIVSEIMDFEKFRSEEMILASMKGLYLEYSKMQLQLLEIMDLSSNELDGVIPEGLCELVGLHGLNLSHNHLSGNMPKNIGKLKFLESLDLSRNELVGTIPQSLSVITTLSYLNLSHNNLSGKIPLGNQLQTLNDLSIYEGNPLLCGVPLPKKCPTDPDSAHPPLISSNADKDDNEEVEDKAQKIWFYFVIFCGYVTGLWAVIGILVFKREWRFAYFRFAEDAKEHMLAMMTVKVTRLKRKMMIGPLRARN